VCPLARHRSAGEGATKNILIVKDVDGGSEVSPETRFAFKSLTSKLSNSDVLRGNFIFLSDDTETSKEAIKLALNDAPGVFDPTGSGDLGQQISYSPDKIWIIKPEFITVPTINPEAMDTAQVRCVLQVEVENAKGRRNDLVKTFTETFVIQPYLKTWIGEAKNAQLQAGYDRAAAAAAQEGGS